MAVNPILGFYKGSMAFLALVVLLIILPPIGLIAIGAIVAIVVVRRREERERQAWLRQSMTWQPTPPVAYPSWNVAAVHPAYDQE